MLLKGPAIETLAYVVAPANTATLTRTTQLRPRPDRRSLGPDLAQAQDGEGLIYMPGWTLSFWSASAGSCLAWSIGAYSRRAPAGSP